MKQITFELTVTFSKDIKRDIEIREVQQNVLDAVINQAETAGLAPEDGDAYATQISIFEPYTHIKLTHKL